MMNEIPINQGVYHGKNQKGSRNNAFADELINLFIDDTGTNYDRPTLDLVTTLTSLEPIGTTYFSGVFVFVTYDRKVWTVTKEGVITDVTDVPLPGIQRPTFANDGKTLFIAGGGKPIKWNGIGSTTQLLGGSPPDMTHIVYMDGFLVGNRVNPAENNKFIQFTDFETPETWPGTSIFSANAAPDQVKGTAVCQQELYLVGERTTELWQNVGSFPVPFARSYVWQYGTRAPYSIRVEDNSVFFIDQDKRILQFSGRQYANIGEAIQADLTSYLTVDDCFSSSFTWNDAIHVLFIFPTVGKGWSINLKNKQWSEWLGFNQGGYGRVRINCHVYSQELGLSFAGDFSTGRIFRFSDTVKTDAEEIFSRERTFCRRDLGSSIRKQAKVIRINLRRDVATKYEGAVNEVEPSVELKWQDDDKGWTPHRKISLGKIGNKKSYVESYRLGIYRNRRYNVRITDPVAFSMTSVETDEEAMTS